MAMSSKGVVAGQGSNWREEFNYALTVLQYELDKAHAGMLDYVIFGSASLVIRDVIDRSPVDIDVFVSKRVWGLLLNRMRWSCVTPDAGNPPILRALVNLREINLFFDWFDPWLSIDVQQMLEDGWRRENLIAHAGIMWPCVTLEEAKRRKAEAIRFPENSKREQHLQDIAAIDVAIGGGQRWQLESP